MTYDYWLPVRERWERLARMVVDPPAGHDAGCVIRRWLNPFAGPELGIALTGMRGAGKTTLHKALRARLPVGEHVDRAESPDKETDRFVLAGEQGRRKRVQLVVVPGQKDSTAGKRTINQYFRDGRSPTGVVHSISWGYSTIWDQNSQRAAVQVPAGGGTAGQPLIEHIRAYNLTHELDDFRQTGDLLREAWLPTRKPIWLLLAMSKVDLYRDLDSLLDAGRYYIPAANPNDDTEFAGELRGLVDHLGQGRLAGRVALLPICTYLESYSTTTMAAPVATAGDLPLTSALLAGVMRQIGAFCDVEPQ